MFFSRCRRPCLFHVVFAFSCNRISVVILDVNVILDRIGNGCFLCSVTYKFGFKFEMMGFLFSRWILGRFEFIKQSVRLFRWYCSRCVVNRRWCALQCGHDFEHSVHCTKIFVWISECLYFWRATSKNWISWIWGSASIDTGLGMIFTVGNWSL